MQSHNVSRKPHIYKVVPEHVLMPCFVSLQNFEPQGKFKHASEQYMRRLKDWAEEYLVLLKNKGFLSVSKQQKLPKLKAWDQHATLKR